jgi:hypothetical protein
MAPPSLTTPQHRRQRRVGWSGLVGSALAAWLVAGCIVQGGEEAERETTSWYSVGLVRFEAKNQRGEIVGSGCTFDTARYREQIRFAAKEGDLVELNERFSLVATTLATVEKYKADADYWCGRTDTMLYHTAPDPRCWKSLDPDDSVECFLEGNIAGTIESVALVPASDEPQAGKTEGFALSIRVHGAGRQCVDLRCGEAGLRGEQLAFVIE